MKVLMVNKFFYIKGGSKTYYFSLKKLLEEHGHTVIDFSMKDEKNFESPYSKFFVENVDYNKKQSIFDKVKEAGKIIYSFEARKKIEELIKETKPDIAHLHIFQHQLSLSILDVLKKYNIPIIYTAHDLKMICPNYKMLTHGKICEECKGQKYIKCLKNKCLKDSAVKSAVAMMEAYINKWRKAYDKIDYIITPSEFYRKKFIEFGIDENKISHIPNFLTTEQVDYDVISDQDYFLYFGRLSEEKGIMTLIKAMEGIKSTLKVVGTGPLQDEIKQFVKDKNYKNIEILGFKSGKELNTIVANAKSVVLPSEWYENGPYSAIESLKSGRLIIGSDLGGIPELIEENKNGFIFKHGNVKELNECIKKIEDLKQNEILEMQKYSKKMFLDKYTDVTHYNSIMKIYEKVVKK